MKTKGHLSRNQAAKPPAPAWSAWDILASLGDSLAVVDPFSRVVWARDLLLATYRPEGYAGLAGEFCYSVFAGREEVCETNCPVRPALASGRPQVVERHIVLKNGRVLWREARAYPIFDGKGRVALVARISFDISERKESPSRPRRRRAALERSLAELNQLRLADLPFQNGLSRTLTSRELEVLRLLAQGLSKPQIAGVLGLSPHTVKRHVDNIFAKLSVNDRAQAAVWAARQGLV